MIAAHADWSVDARKRWMAVASGRIGSWQVEVSPVGDVATLLERLLAPGDEVALGVDFPIGLPREYAAMHRGQAAGFPAFLKGLAARPEFFEVAGTLDEAGPHRPFYPRRPRSGMTRLSHAQALGLADASGLSRVCDRSTPTRPAGAPLFWTLGPNQSGKAAISGWRDLLLPALRGSRPPLLWPFDGPFRSLLGSGRVTVAETYPAEALRQIGLRPIGSKRRQADRARLAPSISLAMDGLGAVADAGLQRLLTTGFGPDAAGEDRLDCVLGLLCVLLVLEGRRPDHAPPDPWIARWEGWVLGQSGP